jgi:hypothetical protein
MRDLWDTQVKISKGLASVPKQVTSIGVKRLMEPAIWAQGLGNELPAGEDYEFLDITAINQRPLGWDVSKYRNRSYY